MGESLFFRLLIMKREGGFSLIELLTVMAVLGVLLVMVFPSLNEWMVNLRIRNTADALLRGLQLARQEAVRRNQTMGFWLVSAPAANSSALTSACASSSSSSAWVVSVNDPAGKCDVLPSVTTDPFTVAKRAPGDGGGRTLPSLLLNRINRRLRHRFSSVALVGFPTARPLPELMSQRVVVTAPIIAPCVLKSVV